MILQKLIIEQAKPIVFHELKHLEERMKIVNMSLGFKWNLIYEVFHILSIIINTPAL